MVLHQRRAYALQPRDLRWIGSALSDVHDELGLRAVENDTHVLGGAAVVKLGAATELLCDLEELVKHPWLFKHSAKKAEVARKRSGLRGLYCALHAKLNRWRAGAVAGSAAWLYLSGSTGGAESAHLERGRTRSVETRASAKIVRADPTSAFLVVEDATPDGLDDLVHLDMTTGAAAPLAQGLAATVDARIDPFSDGILVFAGDAVYPSYGRILRFTVEGAETLAEDISRLHRVASDGRVIYVDGDPFGSDFSLRIRNPDGTDDLVADDAKLYDGLRIDQDVHFPATNMVDLQGDVLYGIETGPDRGLWRMPFD